MGFWRSAGEWMGLVDSPVVDAATYAVGGDTPDVEYVLTGDVEQARGLPRDVLASFGINDVSDRITRDEALSIPAVSRGRDVICIVGSFPLQAVRGTSIIPRTFFDQLNSNLTNIFLLSQTIDDLLFNGVAWWRVIDRDGQGFPSEVERLALDRVLVDTASGRVKVDGKLVRDADMIRFDAPAPGLLQGKKGRSLRTMLLLEDAVRRYGRLDVPLGFLMDSEGHMTETEIKEMLDEWEAARLSRTTGYMPKGITYESAVLDAQKIELGSARAYQTAEIARMLNMPASMVNAPTNDSLTYSTTESNRRELTDITLRPYLTTIEQRLSMGDVTPRGMVARFSLTRFLLGDTATVIAAGAQAVDSGLMTVNEVRTEWLGLAPAEEAAPDDDAAARG